MPLVKATVWQFVHNHYLDADLPPETFSVVNADPPVLVHLSGQRTDTDGPAFDRAVELTASLQESMHLAMPPTELEVEWDPSVAEDELRARLWDALRAARGW